MTINSKNILQESTVSFGTSGARGLVADFSLPVCSAFVHAFINVISKNFDFREVALAIDNRPSSYSIAQACAASLQQLGLSVEYHGVIPTPALAYYSMQNNIPCIMITGSHIPFDRNGLKFYRPDGEISKTDEEAILNSECHFSLPKYLPELYVSSKGAKAYLSRYKSLFDESILNGKRIGIYEHSSAGRDLYGPLFKSLGAEVISLGRSDEFVPIDTEAVSVDDLKRANAWSQQYRLDAIFSTDGDGDRPLVADEKGNWLRGDILGLLASLELNIEALAVPVSCNTVIESTNTFSVVSRTKIGSPYVIDAFKHISKNFTRVAGFEANGGFLLAGDLTINGMKLAALPTRDAVLPALMVFIASCREPISSLVHKLPQRFTWSDRIKDFASEKSQNLIASALLSPQDFIDRLGLAPRCFRSVDLTDGARFTLDNGDIFHLRPSGNAPELRCYAESQSENSAKNYVSVILKKITTL